MDDNEKRLYQIETVLVGLVEDLDEHQTPRKRTYDWALAKMRQSIAEAEKELDQ